VTKKAVRTTYGLKNPPDSGRDSITPSQVPPESAAWHAKVYERLKRLEMDHEQLKEAFRLDHERFIGICTEYEASKKRLSGLEKSDDVTQAMELVRVRQEVNELAAWKRTTRGLVWAALLGLGTTLAGGLYQAASMQVTCIQMKGRMEDIEDGVKSQAAIVQQARELAIERTTANRENIRSISEKLETVRDQVKKLDEDIDRRRR